MAIDPKKLEAALSRGRRNPKGVEVPHALDFAIEKYLVGRQVELWKRALAAALPLVPATTDGLTTDAIGDISKVVNQVYRRYGGLTSLNARLRKEYVRGSELHKRKFLNEMNRAIGVGIDDLLSDKQLKAVLNARLSESVGLIKTLDEEMKARIAKEIWGGIKSGKDSGSIKKLILDKANVPEWRAKLIARDQTSKLFSNLSRMRQEDVGVEEYIWRTVGDKAVRKSHAKNDGKKFRWDSPPPTGHPGEDVQCRCVADPVINRANLIKLAA